MPELKNKNDYNSNPFTLSFDALSRFFSTNMPWAVVLIVLGIIGFLFQLGSNLASLTSSESGSTTSTTASSASVDPAVVVAIVIFVLVFVLIAVIIGTIIKVYFNGMFTHVALKSQQEKPVTFNEAFEAVTKRFWRLFGAQLLADLKILGWTLLLIVPGIVAALRYSMLPYVIMNESENEKGIGDSHSKTKVLSRGKLVEVFGVSTVAAIVPVIGSLIGLSGKAALFNQFNYYNQHNLEKPKTHWLNYLGFVLLALMTLFIGFIVLILVLVTIAD